MDAEKIQHIHGNRQERVAFPRLLQFIESRSLRLVIDVSLISSGNLRLGGMSGCRWAGDRFRSGRSRSLSDIEQDGDEHIAEDIHARAGAGDDPIHGHDEGNGRNDDLFREARGGQHERQDNQPGFGNTGDAGPRNDRRDDDQDLIRDRQIEAKRLGEKERGHGFVKGDAVVVEIRADTGREPS